MEQNSTRRGFTLIELLVVVIIIAILAAIALPQYQKAVLKSRFNALKPTADAIRTSQEVYFMEHGVYSEDMGDLDIKIDNSQGDTQIAFSDIDDHSFVRASTPNTKNRYTMYLNHSVNFAGNTYCEAPTHEGTEATLEDQVCINEGGHDPVSSPDNYTMYLLTGTGTGGFPQAATLSSLFSSFQDGLKACSNQGNTNAQCINDLSPQFTEEFEDAGFEGWEVTFIATPMYGIDFKKTDPNNSNNTLELLSLVLPSGNGLYGVLCYSSGSYSCESFCGAKSICNNRNDDEGFETALNGLE